MLTFLLLLLVLLTESSNAFNKGLSDGKMIFYILYYILKNYYLKDCFIIFKTNCNRAAPHSSGNWITQGRKPQAEHGNCQFERNCSIAEQDD